MSYARRRSLVSESQNIGRWHFFCIPVCSSWTGTKTALLRTTVTYHRCNELFCPLSQNRPSRQYLWNSQASLLAGIKPRSLRSCCAPDGCARSAFVQPARFIELRTEKLPALSFHPANSTQQVLQQKATFDRSGKIACYLCARTDVFAKT